MNGCGNPKNQSRRVLQGYVVSEISLEEIVEEIGAQINLEFDKRCGPRCPHCQAKLPRNKLCHHMPIGTVEFDSETSWHATRIGKRLIFVKICTLTPFSYSSPFAFIRG